jgi:hypothetical protein
MTKEEIVEWMTIIVDNHNSGQHNSHVFTWILYETKLFDDTHPIKVKNKSAVDRAKEMLRINVDISKVKVTPPIFVKLTEKMIEKYEKDLETVTEIQMELFKFGFQADQLHPLRRKKYTSKLKNQKNMWEMLAKKMIGNDKANLRNIKSPHCNVEIPLLKDEV